ncbi:MAG: hypothetical protein H6818_21505 [Phycisphaerales bacterium]|nr:hypothetical protein [Phycisphaerales bacterium]MCB9862367.1 hypothetical protein [Phycisphaerales bacterium]
MARQASSSIGGIAGGLVGILIIGALIATPFYISSLGSDRAQLSNDTAAAVETVRRAVLNMDEHLARISNLSAKTAEFGDVEGDVTIPKERLDELQRMSQSIRRAESADTERGTEIEDVRVAAAASGNRPAANISGKLKGLIAEHDKQMREANAALTNLKSFSVGELTGDRSLEGARIKAIFDYASGRISANHAAFLNWQAEQAIYNASPLVSQLAQLKQLGQSIGMESPIDVSASINEQIQKIAEDKAATQARLDEFQGTIDDYKARIQDLDSQSRTHRLQMAEMQSRSERIDDESGRYAQLAASAREAEAKAEALRYGTLQDATRVMASPEDLVGREYEGGTAVVGLFALEEITANLREQITNLESAERALSDQRRFFDAEEAAVRAATEETVADAGELTSTIEEIIANVQSLEAEGRKASDDAVKHLTSAANAAKTASTAASTWKQDSQIADAAIDSPDAEFNSLINADGHTQGSMQFLEAECTYQIANVRYDQIRLAQSIRDLVVRTAEVTDAPLPDMPTDDIDAWRSEALTQLARAETGFNNAAKSFPQTKANLGNRSIQGKDTVWQAQAGAAAVHLMRSVLKDDAGERKTEKDAAYDLLQKAAEGRERSPLLTPTVDMILELQANPS